LLGCTTKSDKKDISTRADLITNSTDLILEKPAIIAGEILNQDVYPNTKELTLTIPGFEGDKMVYTAEIKESGVFRFEIYPKTKREIHLSPIEDVIIISPGDSLYILKDFKDIGNSIFSGDGANLNHAISKFRGQYLGRYPTDYQQSYNDFKKSCEQKRTNNYKRLTDFVLENNYSDDFVNWANKQIELDFCKALFKYPRQHFIRTKKKLTDSIDYFSFIEKFEQNIDNSIVLADYFNVTQQFMNFQIFNLQKKYRQEIEQKDTIFDLLLDDLFSTTDNNYLAQFTVSSYLNIYLNSNKTEWIDYCSDQIESKINDPFLRNNLQEHYDRINDFNHNPKHFSNAILNNENDFEINSGISLDPPTENNIVKELIAENNGNVIYIDFWATWCPPCIHYMQYSRQLINEFKDEDVVFAFICINSNENLWKEKLKELNIGGQHIYCDPVKTREIRKRFGFSGIPYYMLINKKGTIVDFGHHLNPQSEYVKLEIEKLLDK
jgi:thiol-disulfide isomerase/thioredoxin